MNTTLKPGDVSYRVSTIITSDAVTLYGGVKLTYLGNATHRGTYTGWYSSLSALCQAHPEYKNLPTGKVISVDWEWDREQ
jgi:hypothetical protein